MSEKRTKRSRNSQNGLFSLLDGRSGLAVNSCQNLKKGPEKGQKRSSKRHKSDEKRRINGNGRVNTLRDRATWPCLLAETVRKCQKVRKEQKERKVKNLPLSTVLSQICRIRPGERSQSHRGEYRMGAIMRRKGYKEGSLSLKEEKKGGGREGGPLHTVQGTLRVHTGPVTCSSLGSWVPQTNLRVRLRPTADQ